MKDQVEDMIQKDIVAGKKAPRLTPEHIQSKIKTEQFHVFEGSQLTICCLTLQNGFTVTGESACVSPENFNAEIGQKVARDNAVNKIWQLEGYLLKEVLNPYSAQCPSEKCYCAGSDNYPI